MKRSLLYLGMTLVTLGSASLQATAQDTPYVPPLTMTGNSADGYIDHCVKWNALSDNPQADSRWGTATQGSVWGAGNYAFRYQYQSKFKNQQANDWIFLPDMQLEAAQYDISFEFMKQSSNYIERLNMTLAQGKTYEAHTAESAIKLCSIVDEFSAEMKSKTIRVTIPAAGVYNFGLQSASDYDQYNFYVNNISIVKVDPAAPELPSISATSDGLDATLTVTFPSTDIAGNNLPAGTEMTANISIEGKDMAQSVTGTPGGTASATFTFDKTQTFTATCVVTYTDADGLHSSAKYTSDEFSVRKKKLEVLPDGYTLRPDTDEMDWATFVDANDDHNTFSFSGGTTNRHIPIGFDDSDNKGVWCYEYSETMPADDWIITPAWTGSATGAVKLTYGIATYYDGNADYDICVATSDDIEALKANVVFSETGINTNHRCQEREIYFAVEPDTQYYLAFHLKTPLDPAATTTWYTDFFNIKCEAFDGTVPAAATLTDVVKDFAHAGVSFTITLPTKDVVGNDLPAEPIHADLYMTDADAPEHLTGMPGTVFEKSYTDLPVGKFYEFKVHTYRLDGEEKKGDSMVATGSIKIEIDDTYTMKAPVTFDLRTQSIFELFSVIDANEDNKRFSCSPDNGAQIGYNTTKDMDDWLISKGIVISDADQLYELFLTFGTTSTRYSEKCELYWSTGLSAENQAAVDAIKAEINALDPDGENYQTQKANLEESLNSVLKEAWPAAMTNKVISATELGGIKDHTASIKFDAPCTIYLGIHGCSDKDQMTLTVQDAGIRLHETAATDPAEVTDLVAEGKKSGAAVADVTFKMPVNNYGELVEVEPDEPGQEPVEGGDPVVSEPVYERVSQPLKADLQLTAVVKSATETKTVTGIPGQEMSVEIATAEGVSEITVFVQSPEYSYIPEGVDPDTNADGVVDENDDNVSVTVPMGQGPKATVEVFCGVHKPKAPVVSGTPALADDNLGFTIAWEAVTECANEGEDHLNPEGLVYRVYESVRGAEEPVLVAETADLSATVRLADDADKTMGMHFYDVRAFNGIESEPSLDFAVIMGQPETLPIEDAFADGYAQGMFLVYGMGDFVDPATAGASASESNVALVIDGDQELDVELPKFSTEGVEEGYVEFVYHADANTAPAAISIAANGDAAATELGTLAAADGDNGWKVDRFDLPAGMLGKKAVTVKASLNLAANQKFILDSYKVTNYKYEGLDKIGALAGASARGLEGAIMLQGFAGHEVAVCTPDGRVVAVVNAAADTEFVTVGTGIYLVSANGFAAKVAVK